jgi:hypothetical protein
MDAVAVLGPRSCALELFAELRAERFSPLVAVGLEGSEALGAMTGRRFGLAAGSFPSDKAGVDVPVDFYEALGHDAGALLRRAWANVGGAAGIVDQRKRAQLPSALADVSTELSTTERRGFAGKRRLLRRLAVREDS